MEIKTNGYYRSRGKDFTDETSAGITTGTIYTYLRFFPDGKYNMDYRRDENELDFVKFLENASASDIDKVEKGHFEVEGDRVKFKIVVVYKEPDDPIIFYYSITTPELLMSDQGEEFYFFESPKDSATQYDEFFGPLYFEPFAIEVAKRIDNIPVAVVLEIAAGTGRVTRHLREQLPPSAKLIASDISDDMLVVAKKKLGHLKIDWQKIDAQELPFGDNSVDIIVCCFGYMFVPDRPKAFAEAYRVLKPGGMLLFTTWDKLENNGASYLSVSIAKEYLDEPLPGSYHLSTSMSEEAVITPLLQDAGFLKMKIEKVKLFTVSSTAKETANGLVDGGSMYDKIKERNPAWIDEIKIKLEKELAEKFGAAPMIAPISAVISQAWK